MNDFTIIKCKKCDAALVQIGGEVLTSCEQCGYAFKQVNSKTQNPHTITRKIKNSAEYKRYLKKTRTKTNSPSEPVTKTAIGNNKKPLWFTIMKWYFIISIVIGILTGLFR